MISVIVPYGCVDPWREKLWGWVRQRWEGLFENKVELCVGSSDRVPFSRSQARNNAVADSSGDILVIADADTVPIPEYIAAAVQMVRARKTWVVCHDLYYHLNQTATQHLISLSPTTKVQRPVPPQCDHVVESWTGMLILPKEAWEAVDGYDERFIGWGFEDMDFAMAVDAMWVPHERIPGSYVCHLWHPLPKSESGGQPHIEHNRELHQQYSAVKGDSDGMARLLQRRRMGR